MCRRCSAHDLHQVPECLATALSVPMVNDRHGTDVHVPYFKDASCLSIRLSSSSVPLDPLSLHTVGTGSFQRDPVGVGHPGK